MLNPILFYYNRDFDVLSVPESSKFGHWGSQAFFYSSMRDEIMTKIIFKTEDGQQMILTSNDPKLNLDFPKSNTRVVDLNEKFILVSMTAQEEPLPA